MRTFLTVLGVLIGTASIVVMLSLGIGLKQAMMDQVGSANGLTEIEVSSDGDSGSDALLLDDSVVDTFSGLEHVENVSPQVWLSLPIKAGKYESYVSIVGVTKENLEKIELGEGTYPTKGNSMQVLAGNQILASFMDSDTGSYPYYDTNELPDVDLINGSVVAGVDEQEATSTDLDSNALSDTGTDKSSQFSDSTFSSSGMFSDTGNTGSTTGTGSDFSSGSDLGATGTDGSMTTGDSSLGDASLGINSDLSTDGMDEEISYSSFTSSTKRVPIKVTGITQGTADTYTEYSYNLYTDLDSLKAFIKQNYPENSVIPGQPTDRKGKPYRDLKYTQMTVKVDQSDNVEAVLQQIQDMGYRASSNKEWLEETEKEFMIIEAVLGGIGAISLLVAAIGIANTMTMSTYERTKEIGVMKVLGCSLSNIRSMFLTEAAFIGLFGGIAGDLLSFGLSIAVNKVAPAVMSDFSAGTKISVIPVWLILLSIVFSTLIGMIAGFFPAQRATKLSPLAAIRNE